MRSGKERILVMDDEDVVREVAVSMLEHLGYHVEAVCDGVEAIEAGGAAKEAGTPFDAVLMDLTIPGGMGGRTAVKKILEIDPNIKATVFSGYSNNDLLTKHRDHGFISAINKPFNLQILSRTLSEIFSQT